MAEPDLIAQIPALIEKGGLPAIVGGGLAWLVWKFGGRRDDPEANLTAALNALTTEVREMKLDLSVRVAMIETEMKHRGRDK